MRKVALAGALTCALAAPAQAVAADATPEQRQTYLELIRHYRTLTWQFQRAARVRTTRTAYAERRTNDPRYLQWMVDTWRYRSHATRERALRKLFWTHGLQRPHPVGRYAPIGARTRYYRSLARRLERARRAPAGRVAAETQRDALHAWQRRSARGLVRVARMDRLALAGPAWLVGAFRCIHRHEGAWTANTGNGYYGGLQMDLAFQRAYGAAYMRRWGTADRWPPWAQMKAAIRAYRSGRGFTPWPNTRRMCGL